MEPIKDHQQLKSTGGVQKVILDETITGETDELDPQFDSSTVKIQLTKIKNPEPGDDQDS